MFQRRRYLPEVNDSNYQVREFGKRMAMNAPIQGSAADLLKIAMVKIQAKIDAANYQSKMLLQIHDELVFDVHRHERDEFVQMVLDLMEHAVAFHTPIVAQGGLGNNLFEVK